MRRRMRSHSDSRGGSIKRKRLVLGSVDASHGDAAFLDRATAAMRTAASGSTTVDGAAAFGGVGSVAGVTGGGGQGIHGRAAADSATDAASGANRASGTRPTSTSSAGLRRREPVPWT